MKYKTRRQKNIYEAARLLFICINLCIVVVLFLGKEVPALMYLQLPIELLSICYLIYCLTYDIKRKRYKNNGECFQGYIIGAEEQYYDNGSNTFYLLISFDDNGKKIKYTEGYVGDPNLYLVSRMCSIYKYNGEYIEADLIQGEHINESSTLGIPTTNYQKSSKKMYV